MIPQISVIMPVFNGGEFLQESINSILNQTFANFEFLIGDDGSTDNSWQILSAQKDSRIRLFRFDHNIGYALVLNRLIDASKGELIARQDSDDISLPDRFKKQVEFLEKNPEVGLCGTNVKFFGSTKKILLRPVHDEEIRAFMLINNPITHPTVLFRKSVLSICDQKRYVQALVPAEDYAMWYEFSKKTKLANLPQRLFKYRWHTNNISVTNRDDQLRKTDYLRKDIFKQTLSYELTDEESQLINSVFTAREKDKKNLVILESLLLKLVGKNRDTGYYQETALQNLFFHLWMAACLKTSQIPIYLKFRLFFTSDLFVIRGLVNYISWRNLSTSIYNRLH